MDNDFNIYRRIAIIGSFIPYGKVVTYGQIALLCGKPKNSRQIGHALNRGKAGGDFPAHRVVGSQGYLSGAGAFSGPGGQGGLLREEGVEVSPEGRVDLKKYGWQNSMEDALKLQAFFERENI
jgi:methylated-DNA-protein-cysteine methyltransferase-like protein